MERIYKSMKNVGAGNIVLGIVMIVVGVSVGIITIISGAKLLRDKSDITFQYGKNGEKKQTANFCQPFVIYIIYGVCFIFFACVRRIWQKCL